MSGVLLPIETYTTKQRQFYTSKDSIFQMHHSHTMRCWSQGYNFSCKHFVKSITNQTFTTALLAQPKHNSMKHSFKTLGRGSRRFMNVMIFSMSYGLIMV